MIFRRGFVTGLISVILAVIALFGIIFLGVKLSLFFASQEDKNAKAFMNDIIGKIDSLDDGESGTFGLRGVEGGVLVGWNKNVPIAGDNGVVGWDKKPQDCLDKNGCLCLCKYSSGETPAFNCQDPLDCKNIDRDIEVKSDGYSKILISGVPSAGQEFYFSAQCIYLDDSLNEIKINKTEQLVTVTQSKKGIFYNSKSVFGNCPRYIESGSS